MNIGLCGLGKAGRQFVEFINSRDDYNLSAALCRDESDTANRSVADITHIKTKKNLTVTRISDFDNSQNINVIVDFSSKATTFKLIDLCSKYKINLVICPTDFTEDELKAMERKAILNEVGFIYAPALTVGINAVISFVKIFSSLFPEFSFEIVENHPKFKTKPTKTSQIIAESINKDVPIQSVRLDGYVGVHEIIATNGIERVSFSHESFSRDAFANGALLAADFIYGKIGFFDIKEMYLEMLGK